jgi:hypothetical protein
MRTSRVYVVAFGLLLLNMRPVLAQDRPWIEVSAAYSHMHDEWPAGISLLWTSQPLTFEGWSVSAAAPLREHFALVGEVDGNYQRYRSSYFFVDVVLRNYSYLGGPRFSIRPIPRTRLFGQALVGQVHASAITPSWPSAVGKSANVFALQPGGGVDFWFLPNVGVRGEAAYRRVLFDIRSANEPLVRAGLVVGM